VLDAQEVEDEQEEEDQTPQSFVEDDGEEDEDEVRNRMPREEACHGLSF